MQKIVLILSSMLLLLCSCHVETPTDYDRKAPTATLELIKNRVTGDTLYCPAANKTYPLRPINQDDHLVKITAKDNAELYKISLLAVSADGKEHLIKEITAFKGDTLTTVINSTLFPTAVAGSLPTYSLKVQVQDRTENFGSCTSNESFEVFALHPLELFSLKLPALKPVDGTEAVNFAAQKGKLVFFHFHAVMCLACKHEAVELQNFITSDGVDNSKIYIASFGSHDDTMMDEEYVRQFKTNNNLTFDCFLDAGPGLAVQKFIHQRYMWVGQDWLNGCVAFLPNGRVEPFDVMGSEDFSTWVSRMYDLVK